MTPSDLVTLPPERDLPPGELLRRREHLASEARAAPAAAPSSRRTRRAAAGRGRVRLLALAAGLVLAALLSLPALGVGHEIVSLFGGWREPGSPQPTATDVVVASGEAETPWKIVATPSDQGLCLGLFHRVEGDWTGLAGCGYQDVRGDLPGDVRGDPASKCLASPTTVVPCGSLPRHWIGSFASSGGGSAGLEHAFAFGPLAREVASVELVLTNGESISAHVVERPGGLPLDVYWATWPCPLQPAGGDLRACAEDRGPDVVMAIVRAADGRVLERRAPVWNGNPTGDPNGPAPPSL